MDATENQDCPTTNQISIFHSFNALYGPSREVFPGTMKLKTVASQNKTKQPHQFRMTIQKKSASLFEKKFKSTMCIEIETTQLHPTI